MLAFRSESRTDNTSSDEQIIAAAVKKQLVTGLKQTEREFSDAIHNVSDNSKFGVRTKNSDREHQHFAEFLSGSVEM